MRKEGIVLLLMGWIVIVILGNIEAIGTMILMFLLAGVVPGTRIVFSSEIMFFLSLSSLLLISSWAVKTKLTTYVPTHQTNTLPSSSYLKRRRFKYLEVS